MSITTVRTSFLGPRPCFSPPQAPELTVYIFFCLIFKKPGRKMPTIKVPSKSRPKWARIGRHEPVEVKCTRPQFQRCRLLNRYHTYLLVEVAHHCILINAAKADDRSYYTAHKQHLLLVACLASACFTCDKRLIAG